MADVRVEGPAVERGEEILTPVSRVVVEQVALADEFPGFRTLPAYELID